MMLYVTESGAEVKMTRFMLSVFMIVTVPAVFITTVDSKAVDSKYPVSPATIDVKRFIVLF